MHTADKIAVQVDESSTDSGAKEAAGLCWSSEQSAEQWAHPKRGGGTHSCVHSVSPRAQTVQTEAYVTMSKVQEAHLESAAVEGKGISVE